MEADMGKENIKQGSCIYFKFSRITNCNFSNVIHGENKYCNQKKLTSIVIFLTNTIKLK